MTKTGYIFAKFFATFGIAPIEKYRTAAAFEIHLMRDAETVVGEVSWEEMEGIEDVASEYWQLRKLLKQERELDEQIEHLTEVLEQAQDARSRVLEEVKEVTKEKLEEREKASQRLDQLNREREEIRKEGRFIRRSHEGLKTKLEVLFEEHRDEDHPALTETKNELREKRTQFERIKTRRDEIDLSISDLQARVTKLDEIIGKENDNIRGKAEQQFGAIGKTNKELTSLRNKLGQNQAEKSSLCTEVGRFVIQHREDPAIKQATHRNRGLLSLIEQIRASSNRYRKIIKN